MRAEIKVLTSALWSGNREHYERGRVTVRLKLAKGRKGGGILFIHFSPLDFTSRFARYINHTNASLNLCLK